MLASMTSAACRPSSAKADEVAAVRQQINTVTMPARTPRWPTQICIALYPIATPDDVLDCAVLVTEASKDTPLSDVPKGTLFWGANGASASTVAVHSTQSVLASREAGRDNLIGILSIGIGAISDDQFNAGICGALSGEWWVFEIIQTKQFLVWKLRPRGVSCPSVDGDGKRDGCDGASQYFLLTYCAVHPNIAVPL